MLSGLNHIFSTGETHGRAVRSRNRLIAQSPAIGWQTLYAAIFEEAPLEATEAALGHPSLIYHLARPTEVTRKIEDLAREVSLIGPRGITITPANVKARWHHDGHPEILQVYVHRATYESVVAEMYGCEPAAAAIIPSLGIYDPFLEQLLLAVATALREGQAEDRVYADTLGQTIAVYLARRHSLRSGGAQLPKEPAVPSWKMRRLSDFIEENLGNPLSLESMANQVSLNALYLPRAFKKAFGQTPHQYLLQRRVERAKVMLINTELPISEIALTTGFSSQSHLSHWFSKFTGVSPAAFRHVQSIRKFHSRS